MRVAAAETLASNKTISASQPLKYLKDVATQAESNLEAWLASNLIDKDAYNAALKDDYDAFLDIRCLKVLTLYLLDTIGRNHAAR